MKRLGFLIAVCLTLVLSGSVVAVAMDAEVTITSASASTTSVTVSGTTAAKAVMIQIRNSSNEIISMMTMAVTPAGTFQGTVTGLSLSGGSTVKVYVADFEGGSWAIEEATVSIPYYGGGGSYPSDPAPATEPTPTAEPTPAETYNASVGTDENAVGIKAEINDGIAVIEEISKEELGKAAGKKAEGNDEEQCLLTIDLSNILSDVNGIEIPDATLSNLNDIANSNENGIKEVEIKLPGVTVGFDAKALSSIANSAGGSSITLVVDSTGASFNKKQEKALKGYEVCGKIDIHLQSGFGEIHDFNNGKVTVSVLFKPEKGKNTKNYKAFYADKSGALEKHACRYENGVLTFVTGHFSEYAIVYDNVADILLTEAAMTKKGYVKLSWNDIEGFAGYEIYGSECGKAYRKLKVTDGNSFTVKKIKGKALTKGKTYKFYVVAYDELGNKVKSKAIHFIIGNTDNGYGNVETITAKKASIKLQAGKTRTVGATYTIYGNGKHVDKSHGKALRFVSDCPEVAKVSKDGTVTANSAGTATIYIQDIGGKWCTVTVTVK